MCIIVVYVLSVLVGESIVISIGLGLDRTYLKASLPISLSLFFTARSSSVIYIPPRRH